MLKCKTRGRFIAIILHRRKYFYTLMRQLLDSLTPLNMVISTIDGVVLYVQRLDMYRFLNVKGKCRGISGFKLLLAKFSN